MIKYLSLLVYTVTIAITLTYAVNTTSWLSWVILVILSTVGLVILEALSDFEVKRREREN